MREGRAPPLRFSLCAAANRRADDIRPYVSTGVLLRGRFVKRPYEALSVRQCQWRRFSLTQATLYHFIYVID